MNKTLAFLLPLFVGATSTTLLLNKLSTDRAEPAIVSTDIEESAPEVTIQGDTSERPQLSSRFEKSKTSVDLGVDDEILKTSMAVSQPIARMQKDFLENDKAREAYLNAALSLKGIPIMRSLPPGANLYPLHSGLHSIQQQADQKTVERLLKQIAWTTNKPSSLDRTQFYRDMDEKLEACLESALQNTNTSKAPNARTQARSSLTCPDSCGALNPKTSYKYCACCAQASVQGETGKKIE